jgi:hypothetical protein
MPRPSRRAPLRINPQAADADTPPESLRINPQAAGADIPPESLRINPHGSPGRCQALHRRVWEHTRAEKLRDQGLCPKCGKQPPPEGGSYCVGCLTKQRERYAKLQAQGLCPVCGKRPPYGGYSRCIPCMTRQKPAKRRYQSRQKEARRQGLRK